jgi:hypothetical protein
MFIDPREESLEEHKEISICTLAIFCKIASFVYTNMRACFAQPFKERRNALPPT